MRLSKAYLLCYNVAQFCGWALCLGQLAVDVWASGSLDGAYAAAGRAARLSQLASLAEVAHAALGLVGGSPLTAAMQWAGRSNVLFGVVGAVPEVQRSPAVGAMLLAWALSEVVRYPWYAAGLAEACPRWLTWLRYTAFIPLYPVGLGAEMWAVWGALPAIRSRGLRSVALPNPLNFGFDYHTFLLALMCVYPLLWLKLYTFLFRQRRVKLQPAAAAAGKKRQ